jgi:hypothetical protein
MVQIQYKKTLMRFKHCTGTSFETPGIRQTNRNYLKGLFFESTKEKMGVAYRLLKEGGMQGMRSTGLTPAHFGRWATMVANLTERR